MKKLSILFFFTVLCVSSAMGQNKYPPIAFAEGKLLGETIPLRDMAVATNEPMDIENVYVVPNNLRNASKSNPNALPMGPDPLNQTTPASRQPIGLLLDFQGGNSGEAGGVVPPDPTGAVGPNHYVHAFNLRVKIFDKGGNLLVGPIPLSSFLGSGNNDGDPIVMYDHLADRWFVSQFRVSDNALIIGVSTTPDPTGTFNVYEYPLSTFPDYPHYSVWPNGYYLTANKQGLATYVFERDVMLAGGASPQLRGFLLPGVVRNPNTVFSPEPANLVGNDLPDDAPGYIVYIQDDAWNNVSQDHIKIWEIDLNWDGASTISDPLELVTAPFDTTFQPFGTGDIPQPGTTRKLDSQSGIVSYMVNYRSFGTHNSMVINFNTDVDGNDTSGIRWMELRNTNGADPMSIYQEGTWTIADGDSRFMASNNIDEDGNIALSYNVGGTNTRVGLRFTGRLESDPLGQMTYPETSIIESPGVQTFINRFGDYAHMAIDIDNRTFWHTSEYFPATNQWATRVAAFRFIDDYADDVAVHMIAAPGFEGPYTSSETVEVSVINHGTDTQSNFDIELYVDGALVATETFTGSLDAGESANYTFSQSIDLSIEGHLYEVEARTILAGDEYPDNDEFVKEYLFGDLLAVNDNEINDQDLFMYPVADRQYELKYSTSQDFGDLNFRIMNLLGQQITTGIMETEAAGYRASVNLTNVSTGVYVVEVSNAKQKTSKQIMIK